VAEIGGMPVGLAWGRVDDADVEVVNVYQMWVAPSHRRLGVGQLLLSAIVEWARVLKVRQVVLTVTRGDTSASRLYARAGFETIGEPTSLRAGSNVLAQPMGLLLVDRDT
jgi:GNAT superfamily N-acetyltransferase